MAERSPAERSPAGLRGSQVQGGSAPRTWTMHHRLALASTVERLRLDAFGTALLALTLGVALALPILLYLGVVNLQNLGDRWDGTPTLNLFLDGAEIERIPERLERWRGFDGVADVGYLSPDDALAEYSEAMGFSDAAELLAENPLPPVALVTPTAQMLRPARLEAMLRRFETEPGVVSAQVDLGWVRRLQATLDIVETLVAGLGVLLALAVVLVIGSQTRTAVEQGIDEIRVYKLVGGTDAFVLRPFLYGGALYGFLGGAVACLVVLLATLALSGPLAELARSYDTRLELTPLGPLAVAAVLAAATVLGWLGALLAARRRLLAIEP